MKSAIFLSGSVLALVLAAPVVAQEAEPVSEIIITGEKISRSVQDTRTSVAVTTAKRIGEENLQTFYDVVRRTANVTETTGDTGFTIRGINSDNLLAGTRAGSLATVYVDGAALPNNVISTGAGLDMWDIGQVEIFRGPQSTIQGHNALAGAVVIRSKDPTFVWDARVRASASDQEEQSYSAAIGGPLVEDKLAFRLSVDNRISDGIIYNRTRKEYIDAYDIVNLRGKLLARPSEDLEFLLTWSRSERDSGHRFTYVRTDVPDYFDNRFNDSDYENSTDARVDILTLEARYRISDRWTLTPVVSWNRNRTTLKADLDRGPSPSQFNFQQWDEDTFSQELRLRYEGDALSALFGLYHFEREKAVPARSQSNVVTPVALIAAQLAANPATQPYAQAIATAYAAALPVLPVDYVTDQNEQTENIALFTDVRYRFNPKWSVVAGLRYDHEEYDLNGSTQAIFTGTWPNPAAFPPAFAPVIPVLNAGVAALVAQASGTTPSGPRSFEAWLPKLGAIYDFNTDVSGSFTVQRGYRSGGTSFNQLRSTIVAYDPEYTTNYELALRSLWFGRALSLNANLFYIDWQDQQVNVSLGGGTYDTQVANAGKSHLYGFEVETSHRLNAQFDWYASAGYVKTEFDEFDLVAGATTTDLSGTEFAYAPRWTFSAGATWRHEGFFANLNANYRARVYQETGLGQTNARIKARTLANTKFGYEARHWTASLYVNNLFDERYTQYAFPQHAMLGQPRTVGLILEARY